mgnify:CR=1 FL=1
MRGVLVTAMAVLSAALAALPRVARTGTHLMHFAAFAYVGEATADPGLYYDNNVVGTLSLLKAMRERYDLVVVTNDIYTKEDQRLLTVSGALAAGFAAIDEQRARALAARLWDELLREVRR